MYGTHTALTPLQQPQHGSVTFTLLPFAPSLTHEERTLRGPPWLVPFCLEADLRLSFSCTALAVR